MKVMFDCRREVQTLLYAHSIPLVNVMDLKVGGVVWVGVWVVHVQVSVSVGDGWCMCK